MTHQGPKEARLVADQGGTAVTAILFPGAHRSQTKKENLPINLHEEAKKNAMGD